MSRRDSVMASANYGGEGRAIARGMGMLHASERNDGWTMRALARLPYGPPAPAYPPFEVSRHATAGFDEDRPACEGIDPDLFFPKKGAFEAETLHAIRRICDRCPRREICRREGDNEPAGVWGGATTTERENAKGLRRKKREARRGD